VFSALKTLPKSYLVFYNTHWQKQDRNYGVYEGEADFIIAHPDKGIIVLEVKGGGIQYDSERDQWYSQDRQGIKHEIKDPVEQARRNHYKLLEEMTRLPGWPDYQVNIWHAVCFPDIWIQEGQYLRADLPREQVLDKEDLDNIEETVNKMFEYAFGRNMKDHSPGQEGIRIVEGFLANSFQFHTPLGVDLEREDEKLIELTERQYRALSILGNRKRAAIAGCAGSGKTMLAVRKAQQFSDLGLNVLFVCFNRDLADYLQTRLLDVRVTNFHSLCQQAAQQIGYRINYSQDKDTLFKETYPQILFDASDQIGRVYDAIIVDEGQDFYENYWIALESLLKPDGYLFIFYDDNQNIFHGSADFGGMIVEEPFQLTENCRNTKRIHETVKLFHTNPSGLRSFSPEGREPEFLESKDESSTIKNLKQILFRLIEQDRINNQDIIILTPRSQEKTILKTGMKIGNFTLTSQTANHTSLVQVTSIHRFKGLEKRVVILAEIGAHMTHDLEMLLYVGCSRARTHLVILHDGTISQFCDGTKEPQTET
jgi:hypothetical protein